MSDQEGVKINRDCDGLPEGAWFEVEPGHLKWFEYRPVFNGLSPSASFAMWLDWTRNAICHPPILEAKPIPQWAFARIDQAAETLIYDGPYTFEKQSASEAIADLLKGR